MYELRLYSTSILTFIVLVLSRTLWYYELSYKTSLPERHTSSIPAVIV